MYKLYSTIILILFFQSGFAQVDFVKVNGYNDIRVIIDNPTKLQASSLALNVFRYPTVIQDSMFFYLESSIYNAGVLTADSIYFKGDFTSYSHPSIYSDTSSILAGDTMILRSKFFNINNLFGWQFNNTTFQIFENNTALNIDSIPFNIQRSDSGAISLNYGTTDNYFSTDDIGHDGSAIAHLVPVYALTSIDEFKIDFGPNTVYGGDIQFEIYDSSSFDVNNGFNSSPIISLPFTLTPNRSTFHIPYSQSLFPFSNNNPSPEYYFLVVWFFSNAGYNPIELANSQRNPQNRGNIYYYDANESKWKDSRDTGAWLSNPRIDFFTKLGHIDYVPQNIHLYEHPDLMLYPNPANSFIKIELPEEWPQGEIQLEITDLSGKIIGSHKYYTDQELDLGYLSKGVYLLRGNVGKESFTRLVEIE